jgi:UDP-N-acetylglucosamine--N-acetylmuramyl-(pentapeptide) pyrophosphoryl-undecaprenol N-acetylglucosamine transferase
MSEAITILMAGGGTGGHLYPGIAVAQSISARNPQARCVFLCTARDIDRMILAPTGFESIPQQIVPLPPRISIGGLLGFWRGWRETNDLVRRVLRDRQPAAVVGLGGYAAGVAVGFAARRGIPTVVINPDVIPGKANKYLMRAAGAVCCQFEASAAYVEPDQRAKLRFTGCPIRSDIRQRPGREAAAVRLGIDPLLNTLLITGASQGARTVNEAAIAFFKGLTWRGWQVLHLSGRDHAEKVRAGYRDLGLAARVIDFTPNMADVWAVADLAISRSGASSCAELTACGVPSILMPYPYHKDMHQRANAKVLADAGAAILIDDERDAKKNAEKLRAAIEPLLYDTTKRGAMAAHARALGRPDAADAVADVITSMISAGR